MSVERSVETVATAIGGVYIGAAIAQFAPGDWVFLGAGIGLALALILAFYNRR